ncbi:hypothetical protein HYFRA_00006729 [Hymenoscyphus fraxineus]|uniref:Protein kinase domain-containing protein n=1 Tax=Hymenoscyphus fraxineus TaxID=746836 RepID=A0A9N9KXL0_9HELO|nr:hypothetical protein HYFRA_00006729 [Hymenoscyphus fraxineus]
MSSGEESNPPEGDDAPIADPDRRRVPAGDGRRTAPPKREKQPKNERSMSESIELARKEKLKITKYKRMRDGKLVPLMTRPKTVKVRRAKPRSAKVSPLVPRNKRPFPSKSGMQFNTWARKRAYNLKKPMYITEDYELLARNKPRFRFFVNAFAETAAAREEGMGSAELIAMLVDKDYEGTEGKGKPMFYTSTGANVTSKEDWKPLRRWYGDKEESVPRASRHRRGHKQDEREEEPGSEIYKAREVKFGYGGYSDAKEWLANQPKFLGGVPDKSGHTWRGTKVLGKGAFGHVCLWERDPLNPFEEDQNEKAGIPAGVTKVAVKRLWIGSQSDAAEWHISHLLTRTGSQHVVKAYDKDILMKDVSDEDRTLYLEFCEGGTLKSLMDRIKAQTSLSRPLEEKFIWRYLECIAAGAATMKHGNENLAGKSWEKSVVHYDISEHNILVGTKNEVDHKETPVLKFSDFGTSYRIKYTDVESSENNSKDDTKDAGGGNTDEEDGRLFGDVPADTCASDMCSHYFLISAGSGRHLGKLAVKLLKGHRQEEDTDLMNFYEEPSLFWDDVYDTILFYFDYDPTKDAILTMGRSILKTPYSVTLRSVAVRMLAYAMRDRITPRELLKMCKNNIRICDEAEKVWEEMAVTGRPAPVGDDMGAGTGMGGGKDNKTEKGKEKAKVKGKRKGKEKVKFSKSRAYARARILEDEPPGPEDDTDIEGLDDQEETRDKGRRLNVIRDKERLLDAMRDVGHGESDVEAEIDAEVKTAKAKKKGTPRNKRGEEKEKKRTRKSADVTQDTSGEENEKKRKRKSDDVTQDKPGVEVKKRRKRKSDDEDGSSSSGNSSASV